MGISQDSDALAVIVSEETGRISVALRGEFQLRLSAEQLESILTKEIVTAWWVLGVGCWVLGVEEYYD